MDHIMFEVEPKQRLYHVVKFYDVDNFRDGLHCVPASWIKWQEGLTTVLVVYPEEPKEMTKERVKNYQSPSVYWYSFYAEIMFSTNFYDDAIHYINERRNAERNSAEVTMEIGSFQCSVPNSSLNSEMEESSYLLKFEEEIDRQLNSDPQSLIVNTVDEIMNPYPELSESKMKQEDIYEFKEDVHLNLPFMSLRTNRNVTTSRVSQDLEQGNNSDKAADNLPQTDEKWTLKHPEYSPGLVELMPDSGVYIGKADLDKCLKSSRTCTRLTRLLITSIFTESALKKCTYFGPQRGHRDNRLNLNAVQTIVNFVRMLENKRSSRAPHIETIKSAIRYEMEMSKKDN